MKSGVPSGPLIWTVVAVGLINACLAYGLAHLVNPQRAPSLPLFVVLAAVIGAVVAIVIAVRGWRDHYRKGRMVS